MHNINNQSIQMNGHHINNNNSNHRKSMEFKYVDTNFNTDMVCGVCLWPPLEPIIHLCGAIYCKACVENNNITCRSCNQIFNSPYTYAPIYLKKFLDAMLVVCDKCAKTVNRGALDKHQQECVIDCPDGCGEKVKPFVNGGLIEHADVCKMKQFTCEAHDVYCKFKGSKPNMLEHQQNCKKFSTKK